MKFRLMNKHLVENKKLIIILFIILFLMRIVFIRADFPRSLTPGHGPYVDEGYKVYAARNFVLFGQNRLSPYHSYKGWAKSSPISHFSFVLSFFLLGVGFAQARLVTIVYSLLGLILFYVLIKKFINRKSALIAVALFGFNYIYIMYNRLATLESIALFFLFASILFWMLSIEKRNIKSWLLLFLSIISFICALLVKLVVSFFLAVILIFLIIYWYEKYNLSIKFLLPVIGMFTFVFLGLYLFGYFSVFNSIISNIRFSPGKSYIALSRLLNGSLFRQGGVLFIFSITYIIFLMQDLIGKTKRVDKLDLVFMTWFLSAITMLSLTAYTALRFQIILLPAMSFLSMKSLTRIFEGANLLKRQAKNYYHYMAIFFIYSLFFLYILANCYKIIEDNIWPEISKYKTIIIFPSLLIIIPTSILFTYLTLNVIHRKRIREEKIRLVCATLVLIYFAINLSFYFTWFFNHKYDLLNASRDLGKTLPKDAIILGFSWAPVLCLENKLKCYKLLPEDFNDGDIFERLNITHYLFYYYRKIKVDFMNHPNFSKSINLIKKYNIEEYGIHLYEFDKNIFYNIH